MRPSVAVLQIVDADQMRVLQSVQGLEFLGLTRLDELDRDQAAGGRLGQPHLAEPAATQQPTHPDAGHRRGLDARPEL